MKYSIKKYELLPSTSTFLKELAEQGAAEGTVIVANEQTSGRGRQGKSFFSPKDTGLYMSLLLRPTLKPQECLFITTTAAVAVVRALKKCGCTGAGIKWVNDIYVDDKKVCGILSEAGISAEGDTRYVVLGIGINVATAAACFPDDIRDIAASVFDCTENISEIKDRLLQELLDSFAELYCNTARELISKEYRENSILIGRDINIIEKDGICPARVLDIDDECRLLVRTCDGRNRLLDSGEVSTALA